MNLCIISMSFSICSVSTLHYESVPFSSKILWA
uniref:Uncharacterized protein n=1 Tax=Rhizophora mucronata TaxID=61149 RepID=A0A2P2IXR2_RHIMU